MNLKEELEIKFPGKIVKIKSTETKTNVDIDGKIFSFKFGTIIENFVSCREFIIEEIESDLSCYE